MGCSVYARTIIGVKLPKPPYKEVLKRGCLHKGIKKNNKFCPECGTLAWVKEEEALAGYEGEEKFGEFDMMMGGNSESELLDYYVGIHPMETDCTYGQQGMFMDIREIITLDAIKKLEQKLKKLLEPHGLWNSKMKVGLYLFGYASY